MMRNKNNGKSKIQITITAALLVLLAAAVIICVCIDYNNSAGRGSYENEEGLFLAHFIDVGQGDATLLQSPDGEFMLIDSGPTYSQDYLVKYLKDAGVDKLEYFIITHPHEDHYGGATAVIDDFQIENFIIHKDFAYDYPYDKFIRRLGKKDTNIIRTEINDSFVFADCAEFVIISPKRTDKDDLNESSLCFKIVYENTAFLFTGDAEWESEKQMLASGYNVKADVFKAGHHGSSTSNTESFVKAVDPQIAVVSCERNNDYGHPHREIVALFKEKGIRMLRTDELSNIVISSDGEKVEYLEMYR